MGNRIKRSPISISPLDWNGSSHYGPDWVDPHRFDYYGGYNPNVDNDMAQRDLALGTISAAAGAVNPVLGAAVNLGTQAISNAMTENAQDRYMQKWGSPQAQMRNMAAAGINPYLAAGNITGNSGNSQISTQPTAINPADLDNAVMNPQQAEALEAQIGKGKAEAENLAADTKQKEQMLSGLVEQLDLDNWIKRTYAGKYDQLLTMDLLKADFEVDTMAAQMDLWEQEIRESAKKIELMGSEQADLAADIAEKKIRAQKMQFFLEQMQKNGIDLNTPEGQYVYAKVILGDDERAEAIKDAHYKLSNANARGTVDANPYIRDWNSLADYRDDLIGLKDELSSTRDGLIKYLDKHAYVLSNDKKDEITSKINELTKHLNDIDDDIDNAVASWNLMAKDSGAKKTRWQKIGEATDVISDVGQLLMGIGLLKVGGTRGTKITTNYEPDMYGKMHMSGRTVEDFSNYSRR